MTAFGAGRTGHLTLPRAALLRQLRRHRTRAAVRGEATRRDRVVTAIRQARITGMPRRELLTRLAGRGYSGLFRASVTGASQPFH